MPEAGSGVTASCGGVTISSDVPAAWFTVTVTDWPSDTNVSTPVRGVGELAFTEIVTFDDVFPTVFDEEIHDEPSVIFNIQLLVDVTANVCEPASPLNSNDVGVTENCSRVGWQATAKSAETATKRYRILFIFIDLNGNRRSGQGPPAYIKTNQITLRLPVTPLSLGLQQLLPDGSRYRNRSSRMYKLSQ